MSKWSKFSPLRKTRHARVGHVTIVLKNGNGIVVKRYNRDVSYPRATGLPQRWENLNHSDNIIVAQGRSVGEECVRSALPPPPPPP